jgi:hypothetical protein
MWILAPLSRVVYDTYTLHVWPRGESGGIQRTPDRYCGKVRSAHIVLLPCRRLARQPHLLDLHFRYSLVSVAP